MRFHLKKQLEALWPSVEVMGQAENGPEALQQVDALQPQVVFLDIRMPGMDGLEVAQCLRSDQNYTGQIVFVTAYDQYAVAAFEREAVDYLLKPFDDDRLLKTIERVKQRLQQQRPSQDELTTSLQRLLSQMDGSAAQAQATHPVYLKWVKALHNEEVFVIPVEEVLYFQAGDKYTSVVTAAKTYLIRKPIKELELELNPDDFWRIHRSYIVRVNYIETCNKDLAGRQHLSLQGSKQSLPVSRSYAHLFKQM